MIVLVVLATLALPQAGAQMPTDPLAACDELVEADHRSRESARCFFLHREAGWEDAARKLREHIRRHPEVPWLYLFLGDVLLINDPEEAERIYRQAIEVSCPHGDEVAEVESRIALTRYLSKDNRLEEGDVVLSRAMQIAEERGDPVLRAQVDIRRGWQHFYHGRRLDEAYVLLRRVEEILPEERQDLLKQGLDALAQVSHVLGRVDEALRCKRRLLAMAQEAGDPTAEAAARFDIAVIHITAELPSPAARQEARELFEAALEAAEAAKHPSIEAQAHFYLGKLLGSEDGREHLEACIRIATDLGNTGVVLLNRCRGALAVSLLGEDPEKAQELIEQVQAAAVESPDPWFGWEERLPVYWATLSRTRAVALSLELLDGIEALREHQVSGSGRAGLLSAWAETYYWLSGRLLHEPTGARPERRNLEMAFTVTERMRARVLLETLESAQAIPPLPSDDPRFLELAEVLERKVQVHRRLLRPRLDQKARAELVSGLKALESDEARLRNLLAQASPSRAAFRQGAPATLAAIEDSLGENEAVLSYQFGLDEDFHGQFAGGSWLLVSTRGSTRSYRLPDRVALEPALDLLLGMRDLDKAAAGLEHLHRELLGPALDDLPPGIERLVIIPDGKLHRLPFALLRSAADAAPLIARYQLSVAPSATLWRRWRSLEPPASEAPVLALADPFLAGREAAPGEGGRRRWAVEEGARLEPLPYAREEGQAVVRTLGGKSRLLLGKDATERFLKENDLRRYGVLHFATHAVINHEVPERSFVLLAPGADDEDGWLQPQDIVGLDLDGRAVVLASCDTAAGQVLRGEGPMSLARSFFQAGAPVVVASLWPLPDDQTARLSKELYCRLAGGASVAEALATAQRKMLRRGAPARAWAGLVALGNGDLVPFPGGLDRPWWTCGGPRWVWPVLVILVLASLGFFLLRRRRT